jgi:hypothetical protein
VVELLVAPAKRLRGFVHADTVRGAPFDLDPPGAEGRSYDLTLPAMAVVRGRVTGPTGAPLAGHPVTIYEGRRHVSSWRTAADGGFEFLGLPDGAYRLAVLPPEGSSPLPRRRDPAVAGRDVRIEGARDVDLGTISAWTQTKLRGRVVGPGGKPVAAACVSLTAPLDGRRVESATDRDGRLEIEWFAGAPTELTVERPGLATEARRLESGAGGAEDLEIRLVPGGAVRVLFADANWIASSALRVRRAAGGPDWYVFGGGGGTAPQVLVLLRDLPADDLILSIFVDGREIERRVTVRAGETTEVRIDREP